MYPSLAEDVFGLADSLSPLSTTTGLVFMTMSMNIGVKYMCAIECIHNALTFKV